MALFTPSESISGGVPYNQPNTQPSVGGALASIAGSFLGAIPGPQAPRQPTATELEGQALRPFAQRLQELRNSDLSDSDFQRQARALGRSAISAMPEYQPQITGILGEYSIVPAPVAVTPEDAYTTAINDYAATPRGQAALARSFVGNTTDGVLDEQAAGLAFEQAMLSDLQLDAQVEESSSRLTLLQNDVATWTAQSELAMQDFLPTFTERSLQDVDTLVMMAVSGDPNADTPEERLAYLNSSMNGARNSYIQAMQAAGIHRDVYMAQLDTVLAPYQGLIDNIRSGATDQGLMFEAFRNAQQLGMTRELVESFGAVGANPVFQETIMTMFGSRLFEEGQARTAIEAIQNQSQRGYNSHLDIMVLGVDPVADAITGDVRPNPVVEEEIAERTAVEGADALPNAIDELVVLQNNTASDRVDDLTRNFTQMTAYAGTATIPLGSQMIDQVFSPASIRKYAEAVAAGGQTAQDLASTISYFVSSQIARNYDIIGNSLEGTNLSVEVRNNQLVILQDGVRARELAGSGTLGDQGNLVTAVRNINSLMGAERRIRGDRSMDLQQFITDYGDFNTQDIQNYLDTTPISGGTGVDNIGGGSGGDAISDSYFDIIRQVESGGNNNARNPRSTATGPYQFLRSTWDELSRRRPDLNLTPDGRTDSVQNERAIRAFTEENAGVLRNAGIPINNSTLYAAHFLGAGGAVSVLGKPDNVKLTDALSAGVISANPFLRDMTVADFRAWLERKAGTAVPSSNRRASSTPDIGVGEVLPPSLRNVASTTVVEPAAAPTVTGATETSGGGDVPTQPRDLQQAQGDAPVSNQTSSQEARGEDMSESRAALTEQSKKILRLINRNEADLPTFANQEELRAAIAAGEVSENDVVIVGNKVEIV